MQAYLWASRRDPEFFFLTLLKRLHRTALINVMRKHSEVPKTLVGEEAERGHGGVG